MSREKKLRVNVGIGLNMFFPEAVEIDLSEVNESNVPDQIMDALVNAPEIDPNTIDPSQITWVGDISEPKKNNRRKKNKS